MLAARPTMRRWQMMWGPMPMLSLKQSMWTQQQRVVPKG